MDTTWRFIAEATKLAVGQQPLYNYVMRQGSIVHQVSDGIFDRSDLALDAYEDLVALGDADISMAAERYLVFNYLSVLRSIDLNSPDHLARAKKLSDTVKVFCPILAPHAGIGWLFMRCDLGFTFIVSPGMHIASYERIDK